jgi:hypothetical protein
MSIRSEHRETFVQPQTPSTGFFASTSLNWLVIRGKVQLAGPSSSTQNIGILKLFNKAHRCKYPLLSVTVFLLRDANMTSFLGSKGLIDLDQRSLASMFNLPAGGTRAHQNYSCCYSNCLQSNLLEVSPGLFSPLNMNPNTDLISSTVARQGISLPHLTCPILRPT